MILLLPIRQRLFPFAAISLTFVEEDCDGSHEGEVPCAGRFAHLAMVLALGMIPAVMLFDFDRPVASHPIEQASGVGLLRVKAGDPIAGFVGGLDHLAPPQVLHLLIDAQDLRRSRQTESGSIDVLAPELAVLDPAMALIGRLSLRGE